MISEEEKQDIIDRAVEKAMLMLPEVMANLMASQGALNKLKNKFYSDYPEFSERRDIVTSVIETIEGKNPLLKYSEILKLAVPEIRKRIVTIKKLDMLTIPSSPNRDIKMLGIQEHNPHGEL